MTRIETTRSQAAEETRVWIAVILSLLLAEVGMHEFDHPNVLWGVVLAAVLLLSAGLASWMYRKRRGLAWIMVIAVLVPVAATVVMEPLGLHLLDAVDLSGVVILGTAGPDHGLLGLGHLISDVSVLAIGVFQLVRWYRMRNAATALGAAAAFTACCGTTAVLLAPLFSALGGALGVLGIHVGESSVVIAAVFTAAVAALGFALARGVSTGRRTQV